MSTNLRTDLIGINYILEAEACQEDVLNNTEDSNPEELSNCLGKVARHFGQDEAIIDQLKITVSPYHTYGGERRLEIAIPQINIEEDLSINDLAKRCIEVLKDKTRDSLKGKAFSLAQNEQLAAGEIFNKSIKHFDQILDNKLQKNFLIFRIVVWARNLFSNWQIQSFRENYLLTFGKDDQGNNKSVTVQSLEDMMIGHRIMQQVTPLANQIEQAFQKVR
ncbi:MAG: hypothetical protein PVI40_04380 [Chlamydiota bacterium]|jgi:hypothetical protein